MLTSRELVRACALTVLVGAFMVGTTVEAREPRVEREGSERSGAQTALVFDRACKTIVREFTRAGIRVSLPMFCNPPAPAPTPTLSLTATPGSVAPGGAATLSWTSTGATACTASNGWTGNKALTGTEAVSPSLTTTYTLSCTGPGGSVQKDASVTVTTTPPPAPVVTLGANPGAITTGGTSVVSWSSTNTTSCTASGAWSGSRPTTGSETVSPGATSAYTLTCIGAGGSDSETAMVTVTPPVSSLDHVLISEVYYDVDTAHGSDAANEWIELYNPTGSPVTLSGWTLTDGASSDTLPDGTVIAAGGFLLVTNADTLGTFWTLPSGVPVVALGGALGNGLGNEGDALTLANASAVAVDALSWGTNTSVFSPGAVDVPDGHSLARTVLTTDTNTATDWSDREVPTPGN